MENKTYHACVETYDPINERLAYCTIGDFDSPQNAFDAANESALLLLRSGIPALHGLAVFFRLDITYNGKKRREASGGLPKSPEDKEV